MALVFSCAVGHAPGIVAWPDAASADQRDRVYQGLQALHDQLAAAEVDEIIMFTSEHWTNFFLDHISPFCVGRAETFGGPVEPWLKIQATGVKGSPSLASEILEACYAAEIDAAFADELVLDHGTLLPLHFLTPTMSIPVAPIFINTLAPPQPSGRRCFKLGAVVGEVARRRPGRIAIVATGGMSHDPGERRHGWIDDAFDRRFLDLMATGDVEELKRFSVADLAAAGAGAIELLAWIALAGALSRFSGQVVAYEPVRPWATGIGMMTFQEGAL